MRLLVRSLIAAVLIFAAANSAGAGIVHNSGSLGGDSVVFSFSMLDTLGNPVARATGDSLWVFTFYPGGSLAAADSCRILTDTKIAYRQTQMGSKLTASMSYTNSVANLDGGAESGIYAVLLRAYDSSLALVTDTWREFQLVTQGDFASILDSAAYGSAAGDSMTIDKSNASDIVLTRSQPDSVGTVTSTRIWASTGGDSVLQALDYTNNTHGVFREGFAGLDADTGIAAIKTKLTTLLAGVALTSADSALISRISRRMWGIQLGTAGSTDSTDIGQRTVSVDSIFASAIRTGAFTAGAITKAVIADGAIGADETATDFKDMLSDSTRKALGDTLTARLWALLFNSRPDSIRSIQAKNSSDSVWAKDTSNTLWNGLLNRFGEWNAQAQTVTSSTSPIWSDTLKVLIHRTDSLMRLSRPDSVIYRMIREVWRNQDTVNVDTAKIGAWLMANIDRINSTDTVARANSTDAGDSIRAHAPHGNNWASTAIACGTGSQAVTIYVIDTSGTDELVTSFVTIYNSAVTSTQAFGTAMGGIAGTYGLSASTAYKGLAVATGYYFPLYSFTTGSGASHTDTIRGYDIPTSAGSSVPSGQQVQLYDWAISPANDTLYGAKVTITLVGSSNFYTSGNLVPATSVILYAGANDGTANGGKWQETIFGTDSLSAPGGGSATYEISIEHPVLDLAGQRISYKALRIPASGTATRLRTIVSGQ